MSAASTHRSASSFGSWPLHRRLLVLTALFLLGCFLPSCLEAYRIIDLLGRLGRQHLSRTLVPELRIVLIAASMTMWIPCYLACKMGSAVKLDRYLAFFFLATFIGYEVQFRTLTWLFPRVC